MKDDETWQERAIRLLREEIDRMKREQEEADRAAYRAYIESLRRQR